VSSSLIVEDGGKISLPGEIRERYGLKPDTPLRIIETRSGILLVPLTGEPMSAELARELEEWQMFGSDSLAMFPYEEPEG
jgi:bifunctional DNA-binding transcriptional regulator/antitoxin component of YhaV-PrlF toxin-antitoxin module